VRGQGDVPIYATPEGKAVIDEVAEPKRAQWSPTYGDEWPAQTAYPSATVDDGETLTIGGLRIRAHELGPCESASEALYVVEGPDDGPPVAFTGDLFYNGHHSYNADGFTAAWLDALDRAPALLAGIDTLYPGHGRPAGPEALDAQRRYQLMLREAVRNLAGGERALSDAAKEELTARMSAFLPDPALAWLVGLSADAVAAELAAEPQAVST
jgi:glyoxylase-like metal-dependent hydrolase (beta-lactamase superfamily II)